jgi:hypothetical protein
VPHIKGYTKEEIPQPQYDSLDTYLERERGEYLKETKGYKIKPNINIITLNKLNQWAKIHYIKFRQCKISAGQKNIDCKFSMS